MPDVDVVTVPSSLGLRPPSPGHEPGAWRAPQDLMSAGLGVRLKPARVVELAHPAYDFEMQPGTRIRNGITIREHALTLADAVENVLAAARFAVVVGGDCSIVLGCLLGARRGGRCGLVHVDGHSDFYHPGNYDAGSRLGSVAGMDLALATGRGELLLTHWPDVGMPLAADEDAVQIGEREPGPLQGTPITQFDAAEVLRAGAKQVARRATEHLSGHGLQRLWLHVDLDVLDQNVMPAVDSPGEPGLSFAQLTELVGALVGTGRVLGVDVTIYDPELDPDGQYPPAIVDSIATALAALNVNQP